MVPAILASSGITLYVSPEVILQIDKTILF
jgi:hypothetical protein